MSSTLTNHRDRRTALGGVAILLLWLLLIGCAPVPTATPSIPDAVSTVPVSLTPMPADTLATVRRSGGIAGITEQITIKRDGSVQVGTTVKQAPGGASAASALADRVAATGIYNVAPGRYLPVDTCCDRQTFELQLSKDNKTYAYAIIEGSNLSPRPVLAALNLLLDYQAAAR